MQQVRRWPLGAFIATLFAVALAQQAASAVPAITDQHFILAQAGASARKSYRIPAGPLGPAIMRTPRSVLLSASVDF